MTVYVKFDGNGRFEDPDKASKMPESGSVEPGEVFQSTAKRFKELEEQGIPVTQVEQAEAAKAETPATNPALTRAKEA